MASSSALQKEYLRLLEGRAGLPEGFRCATQGIRFFPRQRKVSESMAMNLSLIMLEEETPSFGAVFTRNRFPGAPVTIGRERLERPTILGVLINNKISNVCTPNGREEATHLLGTLGGLLKAPSDSLFVASTGIIGWDLPVAEMDACMPNLVKALSPGSILPVAQGIMTTDSFPKVRRAAVGNGSLVGIAKGAGMIEPHMATLLCFLCTDVAVERVELRESLAWCVERSLNRISIDSDQSTSDMALLFSSRRKRPVEAGEFRQALYNVLSGLAQDIVRNAEGIGHVIRVRVDRGRDEAVATGVGKAIVNSPLVKTAIFGNDPNVGRIVCAIGDYLGNADQQLDIASVVVRMGGIEIFKGGCFLLDPEKEEELSRYLKSCALDTTLKGYPQHGRSVEIEVTLDGSSPAVEVLGSDLSYEYVRENADYRS